MGKRVYNLRPDPEDTRDHVYARLELGKTLPPMVSLIGGCSPVVDQGQLGSCTANAIASGAMEFLQLKGGATVSSTTGIFTLLSRLDLYYQERLLEGSVNEDAGAIIRDGIKIAAKRGVCAEKVWPYLPERFTIAPPAEADADAAAHKIASYQRLRSIDDIRRCLAEGFPVVMGMPVFESFESETVARTGKVEMPKPGEANLGGHAVLIVGYVDCMKGFFRKTNQGYLIVRNSWGTGWGNKGYFTIPMEYIRKYVNDLWTVR